MLRDVPVAALIVHIALILSLFHIPTEASCVISFVCSLVGGVLVL